MPLVSIITGLYNSHSYLEQLFRSFDEQSFQDWEAILVDDGSKDQTIEMVKKKILSDSRYRLLEKKPEGYPSRTRAAGLALAVGRYIAFCDHDDLWAKDKLKIQVEFLKNHPEVSILHTQRIVFHSVSEISNLTDSNIRHVKIAQQTNEDAIYNGLKIIFSSFMTHAHFIKKVGFHPGLKGVDDLFLFIQLSELGKIYKVEFPLTYYRVHANNLSYEDQIFVKGCYDVLTALEKIDVSKKAKKAIKAQALRTHAMSISVSETKLALRLMYESILEYPIPSSFQRLIFLLFLCIIPQKIRSGIFTRAKNIKFSSSNINDLIRYFKLGSK